MTKVKQKFGYDDSLDAFGCHGIGGIWGGIATGLFAQSAIKPRCAMGWFILRSDRIIYGLDYTAVAISVTHSAVMTGAITLILKKVMNIRVPPEAEDWVRYQRTQ